MHLLAIRDIDRRQATLHRDPSNPASILTARLLPQLSAETVGQDLP
jgi:hypothetical protein